MKKGERGQGSKPESNNNKQRQGLDANSRRGKRQKPLLGRNPLIGVKGFHAFIQGEDRYNGTQDYDPDE